MLKSPTISDFSDADIFSSRSDEISSLNRLKVKPFLALGGGRYVIMMQTDNASIFTTCSTYSKCLATITGTQS